VDAGVSTLLEQARAAVLPNPARRRQIRQSAGLTLRDIAGALEVTPTTVLRWEQGTQPPRARAIRYRELLDALSDLVR
jgi:DNA-binding transcriptional regulator YiaG